MTINLQRVQINGLFDTFRLDVPITNNSLILVGENGSGKSTLINLIYYALTIQWNQDRLAELPFKSCVITINDKDYKINRDSLKGNRKQEEIVNMFRRRLPKSQLDLLLHSLAEKSSEYWSTSQGIDDLRDLTRKYPYRVVSFSALLELSQINPLYPSDNDSIDENNADIKGLAEALQANENEQILFLPTYRRIEKELRDVFPDLDSDDLYSPYVKNKRSVNQSGYIELVEFGMKDVAKSFSDTLKELDRNFRSELNRLTGSYLHDILQGFYKDVDVSQLTTNEVTETIDSMLSRIGEEILSENDRSKLKNLLQDIDTKKDLNVEQKISAHFLNSLLSIHGAQREREVPIRKLIEIVNKYLSHKSLEFNSNTFELAVRRTDIDNSREVPLYGLSSGEKQIVSLFSHIFLSGYRNYFVVIDEPELSISVAWQKRFLQDLKDTGRCSGLIAVTHSPFIFDNSLVDYAHSISEFIKEED
jgi:energy-coupling factor transporter ATP-binding protein EcfA2